MINNLDMDLIMTVACPLDSITIHQMARKSYTAFTLINPHYSADGNMILWIIALVILYQIQ